MNRILFALLASITVAACTTGAGTPAAGSGVPPDVAAQLKVLGRVIDPPATASIYAPLVIDTEPYKDVTVERDVHYGAAERHLADVFTPAQNAAQPLPVLIFVHGGAFVRGARRASPTSPFYDNIMVWAVRNGMVGVNITYRLAPQYPWPAGAEDVGLAVAWVRSTIAAHGGDPNRIYLFGHSAGANHVAEYLAHPELRTTQGPQLAGALMLSGLYEITPQLVASEAPLAAYFGTDASRYEERSAVKGLTTAGVPLWFGDTELDPPWCEPQLSVVNAALCGAGKCPAVVRFASHSHMSEVYSIGTDDHSVGDAILKFIRSTENRQVAVF